MNEVAVTVGASQALYLCLQTLVKPGEFYLERFIVSGGGLAVFGMGSVGQCFHHVISSLTNDLTFPNSCSMEFNYYLNECNSFVND